jgi:hypothetical protein
MKTTETLGPGPQAIADAIDASIVEKYLASHAGHEATAYRALLAAKDAEIAEAKQSADTYAALAAAQHARAEKAEQAAAALRADAERLKLERKPCGDIWLHVNAPSGLRASLNLMQRAADRIVQRALEDAARAGGGHE